MTLGFADGVIPTPFCESVDVLAIGPGLGRTAETLQLVRTVLSTDRPVVMDADALTMVVSELPLLRRSAPTILTPHPGEFARLVQRGTAEVQMERRTLAQQFAQTWGVVVLLKGHRTVITDGVNVFENTTGNPGMATGGSGDVLTGLLAALLPTMLSSGASVVDATRLAAWVHGRAGDLAAEALSQVALTAADVVEYLPAVFRELERRP
jgi:NAD(P)H-hydrate epimerase